MSAFAPLRPHRLAGFASERGRAQARLPGVDARAVRAAFEARYAEARAVLTSAAARRHLDAQRAFAATQCATEMDEFLALAEGFGLDPAIPFALMHLSMLNGCFETDGCTVWARPLERGGAILAKNRDLGGGRRAFPAVFLHDDPGAACGPVLTVGTLGAPGVYSSAINAAGLALADTAVGAPRHGVGWLRYFLMTRLAFACASVDEALDLIASLRHAGGGTLVIADATGATASVELRAEGPAIDRVSPSLRTNHFLSETHEHARARLTEAEARSTFGRFAHLRARLAAGGGRDAETAAVLMAYHGDESREGFCRHGVGDDAHTVSCAIYRTDLRSLRLSRGRPCEGAWQEGAIAEGEA